MLHEIGLMFYIHHNGFLSVQFAFSFILYPYIDIFGLIFVLEYFAEHVCTITPSCFTGTTNARNGRRCNGWRLWSTTSYGHDGHASNACLWHATDGLILIKDWFELYETVEGSKFCKLAVCARGNINLSSSWLNQG